MKNMLLSVKNLTVHFNADSRHKIHAVSDVSFQILKGETLGLVGESGCGKTTIARAIMQFPKPSSGKIFFQGEDLTSVTKNRLRQLRPQFQMIFQDSVSSLNPKRKIIDTIAAPLKIIGKTKKEERIRLALEMADSVGIDPKTCHRRPFQLSGGQCQRVQIARALMADPKLLICDEPVSSLDVSIQAQILNLLEALRKKHGLTMLFISHDLAVVKNVCDSVAVMYLGKFCELVPSEKLYHGHRHPYTQALLSAIPRIEHQLPLDKIKTEKMPSPIDMTPGPGVGCSFRTRCSKAQELCAKKEPELNEIEPRHKVACHFPKC
jgi:peptide/nickel transport system ATP-binding protein